jgi:DNA-binding GntR family transcriptional regulator
MSSTPRYKQIAAILRERIASGQIEAGQPIPSEGTLQQEFGVARHTVRAAVAVLRQDGLVSTVPGLGTYVKGPPPA